MARKQTAVKPTAKKSRANSRVKLAVVPEAANQYRPLAVRRYGIAIILAVVLLLQTMYFAVANTNILGVQANITSANLLAATNDARTGNNVQPLTLNGDLSEAARRKADDMFAQQYWSHVAPDGTTPWYWFDEVGYAYAEAGENLAKNFNSSQGAVAAWLASPSHRENMLKKGYEDVGFAVRDGMLDGKPTTLVVALYGTPERSAIHGATNSTKTTEVNAPISLMGRIGIGVTSLNPVAVGSIVVLLLAANIALVAQMYRRKLPKYLRGSWYKYHGIYKATFLVAFAILTVLAYGWAGQI